VAEMKLIPIKDTIENKRIVLCEDSIVRGTQLKNLTIQKLWDNGAREIHVRPACPPLMFPCPLPDLHTPHPRTGGPTGHCRA
jgi:amidophosphoribosyltransferase